MIGLILAGTAGVIACLYAGTWIAVRLPSIDLTAWLRASAVAAACLIFGVVIMQNAHEAWQTYASSWGAPVLQGLAFLCLLTLGFAMPDLASASNHDGRKFFIGLVACAIGPTVCQVIVWRSLLAGWPIPPHWLALVVFGILGIASIVWSISDKLSKKAKTVGHT